MGRKRCFESLEERRLLADVGALADAAPAFSAADAAAAPPAPTDASTTPSSSPATPSAPVSGANSAEGAAGSAPVAASQNASSSADAGGTDLPGEYASTGSSASSAEAPMSYATPNSDGAYASEYSPTRMYAYGPNSSAPDYSPAQTAALDSLVAALQESAQAARTSSLVQQLNPFASGTSASASSAGSTVDGALQGGSGVAFKPSDLVVRSESQPPLATARPALAFQQQPDALAHPIALLSPGGDEPSASQAGEESAAWKDAVSAETELAAPQFAGPLAGSIAANLELLEQGVDALFERLERWGAEWTSGAGPRRFGQALIVAAGAAAAWEYARARCREADSSRGPYDWRAPRELHLPRRRLALGRGRKHD